MSKASGMDGPMSVDRKKPSAAARAAPSLDGRRLRLDPQAHAGFLVVSLSNRLSASASRVYMRHFGVGVMEWRVIALLASWPGTTANQIGQVSGVDKSSVSRATHSLIQRGYLQAREDETDNRRTLLFLTPEGFALHDRVVVASLAREARFLDGFSEEERRTFFQLMKRAAANLPLVDAYVPPSAEPHKRAGARRAASTPNANDD